MLELFDLDPLAQDVTFDIGEDPDRDEFQHSGLVQDEDGRWRSKRIAYIRTSDRTSFKRCRRRWNWTSHLRQNLAPITAASPLWTGSGFHYALEDFHGYRTHKHPRDAFLAYTKATLLQSKAIPELELPWDWPEQTKLAIGMLEYYSDYWLIQRPPFQTYSFNGRPQVEVHALVPIPLPTAPNPYHGFDEVWYAVTLDRVIEYEGGLAIIDYKTAKRIQTLHFQTDPQVGAYTWIGNYLYGRPVDWFIYQQHLKRIPDEPIFSSTTRRLSTNDKQATTHRHYRRAMQKLYGSTLNNAPTENMDFLNWLNTQEDEWQDKFVRRDKIHRNQRQLETTGALILLEMEDILNPDIALYPNPTRDCANMCPFYSPCVSMDDGTDYDAELNACFTKKDRDFDSWRKYLPAPSIMV